MGREDCVKTRGPNMGKVPEHRPVSVLPQRPVPLTLPAPAVLEAALDACTSSPGIVRHHRGAHRQIFRLDIKRNHAECQSGVWQLAKWFFRVSKIQRARWDGSFQKGSLTRAIFSMGPFVTISLQGQGSGFLAP